ncbi:hypothetical protein LCGC14_2392150 [marine sediment metagenome]|uniref:Uncharacterized protein n=1 Tax=marine sediment metagenome TaxID=412755 RepID=A0A0F9CJZ9_9ZZZZ
MEIEEINQLLGQKYPASVRVTRTTKGYTWEIKIRAKNFKECLAEAEWADKELEKRYGGNESG